MPVMPNFVNLTLAAAAASRTAAGFSGGTYTSTTDAGSLRGDGLVESQTPAAGTTQPVTVAIALVLNRDDSVVVWGS